MIPKFRKKTFAFDAKVITANLPKARPIEDFWANLKAEVYKGDWRASNLDELQKRIVECI